MLKLRNITCPRCGAMLEVTNPNNLAVRDITCPNPKCKALLHVNFDDGETILVTKKNSKDKCGYIKHEGQNPLYLREGRFTIGRADRNNTANLGIETQDMSMSRLHCQLEVVKLKSGKVKVIISDLREQEKIEKKPVLVNEVRLSGFDKLVLDDGDRIKLGNTIVWYIQE